MNRVFPRRGFGPAGGATDAADETVSGMMDMEYVYTAGANNRRISSSVDHVVNETVNYTYDSLNRLTQAVTAGSGGWGQGFSYDGFGNLTGKTAVKGTVPVLSVMFDGTTNRQVGQSYDANGNPAGAGYDVENRMTNWGQIAYDHAGKRVFQASGAGEYYVYGIGGQKLMTRTCVDPGGGVVCTDAYNVYFGGKLVKSKGVTVVTDRLGSVRANGNGERFAYYPYGEERGTSADGREKFGTYTRDSSGLDYADQRYYGVGTGRFGTPDPYMASGGLGNPASWNRYVYVEGDPVNFSDPAGLCKIAGREYPDGTSPCPDVTSITVSDRATPFIGFVNLTLDHQRQVLSVTSIRSWDDTHPVERVGPQYWARTIAFAVNHYGMSDCAGLGMFADKMAGDTAAQGGSLSSFVAGFGQFVPTESTAVQVAESLGISISSTSPATVMLQAGHSSGFAETFQESLDPMHADQTHHFAAFFQFGYEMGATAGAVAAYLNEWKDLNNAGDIALGKAAAQMGAALRAGNISASDVGDLIRSTLCKH